jgi:hypothetical protein
MSIKMEMLVRMNVNGAWKYPGDIIEVESEADAKDMITLWQAKRVPALLAEPPSERSLSAETNEQPQAPSTVQPALRPARGKYRDRELRASR